MTPVTKGIRIGIAIFAGFLTIALLGFTFMAGIAVMLGLAAYTSMRSVWRKLTGYAREKHDHVSIYHPDDHTP